MKSSYATALCGIAALYLAGCAHASTQQSSSPSAQPARAESSASHIRGTIAHVSATAMSVTTSAGTMKLRLPASVGVAAVVPATRAEIKTGTFIGVANVPQGKTDRALEVVVFPNSLRGTGEGNYPWDLPAKSNGGSMMTNGTVASQGTHSGGSMMTNGTVSSAQHSGQMLLNVRYKGGVQHIIVPQNAPIVRIEAGRRALLVPGAHVFVMAAKARGHLLAMRIIVGKNGAVPPM